MNVVASKTKMVVDEAKYLAGQRWTAETEESAAVNQAGEITAMWQDRLIALDPDRFKKNFPIGGKLKTIIDLVDFHDNVAYELKVSGKNPEHEFYKDLFKAVIYNQHHNVTKLKRLVFITESKSVDKLETGLAKAAADFLLEFNITVELARLD